MFKNCIKKEILEELRTKRFIRITLLAISMVFLTAMIIGIMSLVSKLDITMAGQDSEVISTIMQMFEPTYSTYAMYFGAFMMTYFTIICVVMNMSAISKEITQNKWVVPISAGILPETMISARLIVRAISVMISGLIAMILHFIFALILFDPTATFGVGNLLLTYLAILVFSAFMVTITISINAISKKGWLSAMLPIVFLIVGTTTMESILVGNTPIIAYTPFMFYELAINVSLKLSFVHWLSASIGLFVVVGGLIAWAILSSRVKPNTFD